MTRGQESAAYEARNARANHQYRVSRCARCLRLPDFDGIHPNEWLCVFCQEARKTA